MLNTHASKGHDELGTCFGSCFNQAFWQTLNFGIGDPNGIPHPNPHPCVKTATSDTNYHHLAQGSCGSILDRPLDPSPSACPNHPPPHLLRNPKPAFASLRGAKPHPGAAGDSPLARPPGPRRARTPPCCRAAGGP